MTRVVRLRPWQKAAVDRFLAEPKPDFLAVATPGAGKTTFALTAGRHELAERPARLIVVAPTAHLKLQWARAAAEFSLHLDPARSAADGALAPDMHGIVTSYQQVASSASVLARVAQGAFVVFDELHHAAEDRAWARRSRRRSPTPPAARALRHAVPVGDARHSVRQIRRRRGGSRLEYSYGDALVDRGVVRPVYFPRTNGEMEWSAPDGSVYKATFDDSLDAQRSSQRLRTALSLEGEWLPTVLRAANERLKEVRREQPDAGGIVIATDQEHARGIASMLKTRFGAKARVVVSDDPGASAAIQKFADGRDSWLVAVRMVSEGVDIPRLRVGVYATTTTTELFFGQAVGRFVRWTRGVPKQRAWLFIPGDPKLRMFGAAIAEQRRHSLRRRDDEFERRLAGTGEMDGDQVSLFAVISAVATEAAEDGHFEELDEDGADYGVDFQLAPPPPLAGPHTGDVTRTERKRQLRDANAHVGREIARRTGLTHVRVNAELNKLSGIRRVAQATIDELDKRLVAGNKWLAKT